MRFSRRIAASSGGSSIGGRPTQTTRAPACCDAARTRSTRCRVRAAPRRRCGADRHGADVHPLVVIGANKYNDDVGTRRGEQWRELRGPIEVALVRQAGVAASRDGRRHDSRCVQIAYERLAEIDAERVTDHEDP